MHACINEYSIKNYFNVEIRLAFASMLDSDYPINSTHFFRNLSHKSFLLSAICEL